MQIMGREKTIWQAMLISAVLIGLVPGQSANAKSTARATTNAVTGKLQAPSMEDAAAYFAESKKGVSATDLKRADALRKKTIESIKDLLASKKKSVRRFELLLRLGEIYVERHDYIRDLEMNQFAKDHDAWKAKDPAERAKVKEPVADFAASTAELTKAANAFRGLVNEYPKHPRTDAALYALAQTLARLGKDTAVDYYKQLLRSHPRSPLVPDAYLSLGEYYFDKHDIPEAITYYKKVMETKEHRAYPYAVYKLGWANYNAPQRSEEDGRENYKKAVAAFKLVIKLSDRDKEARASAGSFDLREEAIRDLVMVWAEAGDVASAWRYFRSIDEQAAFYKMLERLGNIYYDQGKHRDAVAVFERLLREAPKREGNPAVHAKLVELHDLMNDIPGVVAELKNMKALYLGESVWAKANANDAEQISEAIRLVDLNLHRYGAMFHQRGQKTKSPIYLKSAAAIYAMYLESYPKSSNAYDIRYYLAEILYDFKQYEDASSHYLVVAKAGPTGKYFKQAALNSVSAMHDLVKTQKFGTLPPLGQAPKPIEIPRTKKKLIEVMDQFVAMLPKEKEADAMRYEAAQIAFEFGHYQDAIKRFDKITKEYPETKQARASVKVILGYFADKEDWNKTIGWCQEFARRETKLLDTDLRKYVLDLQRGSMFRRAMAYEKAGKYERAARGFLEYQREFPQDANAGRSLYNAALNFFKASKVDNALAAEKLLVTQYPKSDAVPNALADMASTTEALAKFEDAAALYRRLGVDYPKDPRAPNAIFNAAVLHKGLKNYDEAISLLGEFLRRYPDSKMAPDATMELAELNERTTRYSQAVPVFEAFARRFADNRDRQLLAAAKAASLKYLHVNRAEGQRDLERVRQALVVKDAPLAFEAREVVAGTLFRIADPSFGEFQAYRINDGTQIERQVGEKQKRLVNLAQAYERIIEIGSGEFTVASLYRLGEAHENFSAALFRAPAPKGASQKDTDHLKTELEKVAFPLKEEAYKFYETAYKRSKEVQTFTAWTRRTYSKMVELAPDKHPQVDEISADATYLSHTLGATGKRVAELEE